MTIFRLAQNCNDQLMQRCRPLGYLVISLSLSGCHVVEKARQCSALSVVLEKASEDIGSALPESPSSQALGEKAAQYQQLIKSLQALGFKDTRLSQQQEDLTSQFEAVEKELGNAAKASKELESLHNETNAAILKNSSSNGSKPKKDEPEPDATLPERTAEVPARERRIKDDDALAKRVRKHGPSPRIDASRRHEENVKRRYMQAARAIEASNDQIRRIVKRISDLCRD